MTPRRRLISAVVITAIAFAVMLVFIGVRLEHWSEIGWAGVNYFPQIKTHTSGKVKVRSTVGKTVPFMLETGRVIVSFPGSPAARAGLDGNDTVQTVNG